MKTFKVIKNDTPLTDEEILIRKPDFSRVAAGFGGFRNPFYKSPWFMGGAGGFAVIAALLAFFLFRPTGSVDTTTVTDSLSKPVSCIQAPLHAYQIPYEEFVINPMEVNRIQSVHGSVITIPAGALADKYGRTVTTPVSIRFREFHNPIDFFLSGIPMNYDSAGSIRTFESAGMFQIFALLNNDPLFIIPGNEIRVDLKSEKTDGKFGIYRLDSLSGRWTYLGTPETEPDMDIAAENNPNDYTQIDPSGEQPALSIAPETKPWIKPKEASKSRHTFKIDYKTSDFPELASYRNVLFEVDESKTPFDPVFYQVNWSSLRLKSSKIAGNYILILATPDTSIRLYVYPVFASRDYMKAVAQYEQHQKQTEQAIRLQKEAADKATAGRNIHRQEINNDTRTFRNQKNMNNTEFRTAYISSFGTYNHDNPLPFQDYTFSPRFAASGQPLEVKQVYIVDKQINALFTPIDDQGTFRVNRKAQIVMWVVTPDNRIGIVNSTEFDRITRGTEKPFFSIVPLQAHEALKKLQDLI